MKNHKYHDPNLMVIIDYVNNCIKLKQYLIKLDCRGISSLSLTMFNSLLALYSSIPAVLDPAEELDTVVQRTLEVNFTFILNSTQLLLSGCTRYYSVSTSKLNLACFKLTNFD